MPKIVNELTGVPRTLLLPLRGRAEAQAHPYPLFQDPLSVEWLKLVGWDTELDPLYGKAGEASTIVAAIRTYHHDQIASSHIANHSHPVVVELGAGLSSRFHRVGQNTYRWLELDLPVVTKLRSKLDTETQQHQFISASVMDFDWMDALPKVSPENILFIAEGLLMYLDINEVQQLISVMRSRFPGATLDMEVIGNSAKQLYTIFDQIGAPLKWFINDEEDLTAMGLQVVNSWSMYQLYQERWPWYWKSLLKFLTQFPYFRNSYLIVETKL
ncbi:class I SAM-dependent methyltransferase [Dapis sp. BLCC M172]|uniref:class I SAM-dependent methyltransferase n=1 Tax=Dapis sp. BLCC M172 TaxID=2975281 RepID=UPI003CEE54FB